MATARAWCHCMMILLIWSLTSILARLSLNQRIFTALAQHFFNSIPAWKKQPNTIYIIYIPLQRPRKVKNLHAVVQKIEKEHRPQNPSGLKHKFTHPFFGGVPNFPFVVSLLWFEKVVQSHDGRHQASQAPAPTKCSLWKDSFIIYIYMIDML